MSAAAAAAAAAAHKSSGNAAFSRGDFTTAIAAYTAALALDDDATLLSNRSAAHLAAGDAAAALADGAACAARRPDWGKAHGRAGAALSALGLFAEAAAAYERGLAAEPGAAALAAGREEVRAAAREAAERERRRLPLRRAMEANGAQMRAAGALTMSQQSGMMKSDVTLFIIASEEFLGARKRALVRLAPGAGGGADGELVPVRSWSGCEVCHAHEMRAGGDWLGAEAAARAALLSACGGCGNRFYCSPACQRADWAAHKGACTRLEDWVMSHRDLGRVPSAAARAAAVATFNAEQAVEGKAGEARCPTYLNRWGERITL